MDLLYCRNVNCSFSSGMSCRLEGVLPSSISDLWIELKAMTACKTAGSLELAWNNNVSQNDDPKTPGSFITVRCVNHSKYPCSSMLTVFAEMGIYRMSALGSFGSIARSLYAFPPPPQIPYPSHTRPVDTQR